MARVFVLALALATAAPSQHSTVLIAPRGTPHWLVRDAFKFSRGLHDPRPRRIRIVLGRFDTVAIRGRFVCTNCHGIWTTPPRGTLVQYVIDPRTHDVVSFNLLH